MTDHGTTTTTTTTFRRIGEEQPDQASAPSGLRRIADAPPPAPTRPASEGPVPAPAASPASAPDTWAVPHLDDLAPPAPADEPDTSLPPPVAPRRKSSTSSYPVPEAPARRGPAGRVPVVLLALLSAVLVVAVIILGVAVANKGNTDDLRASALATARIDGVLVSSYDYHDLTGPGSDWVKVENASTPQFRKNFLSTSVDLGKVLVQYNAVATGKVLSAGIASLSGNRAVVLLFIDQTVNNTVQKSASTTPLRSEIFLVRQGGRWLINDLQVPK